LPCRLSLRAFSMVRFSGIPSSIHPAVNDNVRTGRWFAGRTGQDRGWLRRVASVVSYLSSVVRSK
jgi:hypothetical protein